MDYKDTKFATVAKKCSTIDSNVLDVMSSIDAVIFTGGEDIAPTFYDFSAN